MLKNPLYQGITLIQFLLTLLVVSILAVISIPSFRSIINKHRLSVTAENLYAVLQYARSEAIKRNASIYVAFTTGDSWCYGVNPNATCNCTIANSCTLGTFSASEPQKITLSISGSNPLIFEGTHGGANASNAITLTLYGDTPLITVSISRLGNIKRCATGVGGYTAC